MKEASFQCLLKIYFDNEYDLNEITKKTGIVPYVAKCYSESGYTKLGEKQFGRWEYYEPAKFNDSMSLNEVLTDFLRPFSEDKLKIIREIVQKNNGLVELVVNIYFHHEWLPEMVFGENVMRVLYGLNANISLNMNEKE